MSSPRIVVSPRIVGSPRVVGFLGSPDRMAGVVMVDGSGHRHSVLEVHLVSHFPNV